MNLELALIKFESDLKTKIKTEYEKNFPSLTPKYPTYVKGNKYIKVVQEGSCWGFISKVDGTLKGLPIKKGDLLKAANWRTPAKHSRGNIIDGTAMYTMWGPAYLK